MVAQKLIVITSIIYGPNLGLFHRAFNAPQLWSGSCVWVHTACALVHIEFLFAIADCLATKGIAGCRMGMIEVRSLLMK